MMQVAAGHNERMRVFRDAGIYLATSREHSRGRSTEDIVRSALDAGVRLIQLREKTLAIPDLVRLAGRMRELTAQAGALLLINDRLDVALAVGADGVHLGLEDLPIDAARRIAPEMIIGASTHSTAEAIDAQTRGASYVNIGPVFPTRTKEQAGDVLGIEGVRAISRVVTVPFSVMGGIKKEHIPSLVAEGAAAIALITAVTAADDPGEAARELLEIVRRSRREVSC